MSARDEVSFQLRPGSAPRPDELTDVLRRLVSEARDILGDNYVGAYLQGSVAQGAADLESDCDFLVVVREPLSPTVFSRLAALHARLPTLPGHWSRHLEGSYPVAQQLASLEGLGAGWAYVDHGSAVLEASSTHCNTPVVRRILREHGVTLDGPDAGTLVEAVPDDAICEFSRRELARQLHEFDHWSASDAWSQRYAVLTVARLICSIETGDVITKRGAVAWASDRLDPEWAELVGHMAAARGSTPYTDPADPAWDGRTAAFGRFAAAWLASDEGRPRG